MMCLKNVEAINRKKLKANSESCWSCCIDIRILRCRINKALSTQNNIASNLKISKSPNMTPTLRFTGNQSVRLWSYRFSCHLRLTRFPTDVQMFTDPEGIRFGVRYDYKFCFAIKTMKTEKNYRGTYFWGVMTINSIVNNCQGEILASSFLTPIVVQQSPYCLLLAMVSSQDNDTCSYPCLCAVFVRLLAF
jgi:hypothetical protein